MTDIRKQYKTKEEVHNRALEILNIKKPELVKLLGYEGKGHKNSMGDLFEEWFGKPQDNSDEPDLGVSELKATPFKQNKNGSYSNKERLVLTMINFCKIVDEKDFEHSHLFHKNKVIELAFYQAKKAGNISIPDDELFFKYAALYEMAKSPKDLAIIKNDYNTILKTIRDGHAETLSEGDTNILGACTKAASSKNRTKQPFSDVPVKPRAFSIKNSYMTQLLHKVMNKGKDDDESIITDPIRLEKESLEDIILDMFKPYIGLSQQELMDRFNIHPERQVKNINNMIVKAMLNLNSNNGDMNRVDEFNKSGIIPKTVQFNDRGTNKESMSFPAFKFKDLVNEHWVDADGEPEAALNQYLFSNRFLLIVFQYADKNGTAENNIFRGARFFNVPLKDLDGTIKDVWERTKKTLEQGVALSYDAKSNRVSNDFISKRDGLIVHVRPHTAKSSYVNDRNANELPTRAHWTNKPANYSDDYMTTQCFWLNSGYIKAAVADMLKHD